jgi:hypothetical protein
MRELGRSYYPPAPAPLTSPDDVVVQVADIIFDYLSPENDISADLAVTRIRVAVESPAGMEAYLTDALEPAEMTNAADVVVQLVDVLESGGPNAEDLIARLSAVMESPLALEAYDQEMQRRQSREAERRH